jgi:hypothetical protein
LFFRIYPPRFIESRNLWRRADKIGAFEEWQKLTAEEKIAALNAVQREKASKWTPDARKWLKHKAWEDEIAPLREFDRPPPKEIQAMLDRIGKKTPLALTSGHISNYQLNKRRNKARDQFGV